MNLLLLPSRTTATWVEQFGRVIIEAQASGAIVAGYATGAIPEVLDGTGITVPEGQIDVLCAGILGALRAPAGYERLRGAWGIRAARCTWAAIAHRMLSLYQSVAEPSSNFRVLAGPTRLTAHSEFGPPAQTAYGGRRPWAVPARLTTIASMKCRRFLAR